MQMIKRGDTKAWQVQVWVSFGLAVLLCGTGLAYLPGADLDRAFMVMGYFFCLCAAFTLAKTVRDEESQDPTGRRTDMTGFKYVAWIGFFLAMALTAWGLMRMDINQTYKAFLGVCWLYLITTAFTLAKMLRDRVEAQAQ